MAQGVIYPHEIKSILKVYNTLIDIKLNRNRMPKVNDRDKLNQLAARISFGDEQALEKMIDLLSDRLNRYLIRIGVDRASIDDVLQNTYLKAYVNINSFNAKKGDFTNWIYRITHNEAINHMKKTKYVIPDTEEWAETIESEMSQAIDTENKLKREAINEAITSIDMKYRDPLILNLIEGKSYQDISFILKMPVSTVGTRIKRAKSQLQKKLSSWKEDG